MQRAFDEPELAKRRRNKIQLPLPPPGRNKASAAASNDLATRFKQINSMVHVEGPKDGNESAQVELVRSITTDRVLKLGSATLGVTGLPPKGLKRIIKSCLRRQVQGTALMQAVSDSDTWSTIDQGSDEKRSNARGHKQHSTQNLPRPSCGEFASTCPQS